MKSVEAKTGRCINTMIFTGVYLGLFLFILSLVSIQSNAKIITDNQTYHVNEVVLINISDIDPNHVITITSDSEYYKFLGLLSNSMSFVPKKEGTYTITEVDDKTGQTLDSLSFDVVQNDKNSVEENQDLPDDNSISDIISISKDVYTIDEEILISIADNSSYELNIQNGDDIYRFMGTSEDNMTFFPKKEGLYVIEVLDSSKKLIAEKSFTVISSNETNENVEAKDDTQTNPLGNGNVSGNDFLNRFISKHMQSRNITLNMNLKDRNGQYFDAKVKTQSTTIENYSFIQGISIEEFQDEIVVEPKNRPDVKIRFTNINISQGLNLDFDSIDQNSVKIKNRRVKESFFVENLNRDYETADLIFTATGEELYRCDDYDVSANECVSSWEKYLDIVPGEDYAVQISQTNNNSIGFAETGVATINTKKPIYEPGESAELEMVVLDNKGYPVSGASVNVLITSPNNNSFTFSTANKIIETKKGVYEFSFEDTNDEGKYEMSVSATGSNINYSMSSEFFVQNDYNFDIIRDTPATFDPWMGPYIDRISVYPKKETLNKSSYSFTEVIPAYYEIVNPYGGIVDEGDNGNGDNGTKRIRWENLSGNSVVSALIKSPLKSPNIDIFGKGFIEYIDDGDDEIINQSDNTNESNNLVKPLKTFYEARKWYTAVDPITSWKVTNGTAVMIATQTVSNITLSSAINDTTHAFLLMSISGPTAAVNAASHQITGFIVNTTTIRFVRYVAAGAINISYYVIENTGGDIFVQRGNITLSTTNRTNSTTLATSVNASRSFVIVTSRVNSAAATTINQGLMRGELSDSSTVQCARAATGTAALCNYEVIETKISGITVQTGLTTITGTTANAALTDNVDLTRSLLLFSYDSVSNGVSQTSIGGQIASSSQVNFTRFTGTYNNTVRWYVIQFPNGTNVQRGSVNGSTKTTAVVENISISTVNLSRAISYVTTTSDSIATGFPRNKWINALSNSTNIRLNRYLSGSGYWNYWQVLEFPEANQLPNVTLIYPQNADTSHYSNVNFNFIVVDDSNYLKQCSLYTNDSTWGIDGSITDVQNNTPANISYELLDGNYIWNVMCEDYYGSQAFSQSNISFTVAAVANVIVNNIEGDSTEKYSFTNRTPKINMTVTNRNATCYVSTVDEDFNTMIANSRVNCGAYIINVSKNCSITNTLPIGDSNLFVSCNTTKGIMSNSTNNKDITIDVLCDSHSDCGAGEYCNIAQNCLPDVLNGYNCQGLAYGGGNDNETCQSLQCSEDTWDFQGFFCAADSNACVYNDNTYDQNYLLCNSSYGFKTCEGVHNWDAAQTNCAILNQGANKTATAPTHMGFNCSYYALAQSCQSGDLDLGSFGCTGPSTDCGSYVYLGSGVCGSILADCDIGCGAECDSGNSTSPGISGGLCYFDKSCSASCAWSMKDEAAPSFCIDDSDGGACVKQDRADPEVSNTCYFSASCQNGAGANLDLSGTLKLDYCDFCNSSGNHSGSYSPSPNSSCLSNCPDSGVIYYDNDTTPLDRSDDCLLNGNTSIVSSNLFIGYIWNGSGQAYCDDTECQNDCGEYLTGTCQAGACFCNDSQAPILSLLTPEDYSWINTTNLVIYYNVTDLASGIQNCSLKIGSSIVNTTTNPAENTWNNFSRTQGDGAYAWNITCYDNSANKNINTSETRHFGVDTSAPAIINPMISAISFNINEMICLKVTSSDSTSGLNRVYALVNLPEGGTDEVDFSDSQTTPCDSTNGDGIYSAQFTLVFAGTYNWTYGYALDNANNQNNVFADLTWNVSSGGKIFSNMTAPQTNLTINESEANYYFNQNCTATCLNGTKCKDIFIFPQYYENGDWQRINYATPLFTSTLNYSCGNLSTEGSASWWNSSWQYRKRISVTNNNNTNTLASNYTLGITVNTTSSSMLGNGNDVRVVYWNGTNNNEIDRINTTTFNSVNTNILFKIQKDISAGAIDSNYYIYYGNPGAGSAPNNKSKVYDFWDDFSGGLSQWTVDVENTDAVYVNASVGNPGPSLMHNPDSSQTKGGFYDTRTQTTNYKFQDGIIEYDIYLSGTARSIHQFGFRVPNLNFANGYAWRIQSSAADGGWMRFTGIASWTAFGATYPAVINGTWHHVILNVSGANYNATVDGGSVYSGTDNTKLTADYLVSHVHATGTDYYVLLDNVQARKIMFPAPTSSLHQEESPPINISCSHVFNISSQVDSGNHTYTIRCEAASSNSPTDFSANVSIKVNAHPVSFIDYPSNSSWTHGIVNFSASSSYDPEGNISNYLFFLDNNSIFTSPQTLCSTSQPNCTLDTTAQSQCIDSVFNNCYIKTTITDNLGLKSSTTAIFGIDNTGPLTILGRPLDNEEIDSDSFNLNASSLDGGVGSISYVLFEYRYNSTDTWKPACNDSLGVTPFSCIMDISSLIDGKDYEFRSNAIDALGNIGPYDSNTNIKLDRTGPISIIVTPFNKTNISSNAYLINVSAVDLSSIDTIHIEYRFDSTSPWLTICYNKTGNICLWDLTFLTDGGNYQVRANANDSLGNVGGYDTTVNITIDRTGPTTTIIRPADSENIYGTSYNLNATAIDYLSRVDAVIFEYRASPTDSWHPVCSAKDGTNYFNCTWDISGLADGLTYEIRASANDSLGNVGDYNSHMNIKLDNNGPQITLLNPGDRTSDGDGDIYFTFTVNDGVSGISYCSLYINGTVNQTNNSIAQGLNSFSLIGQQNGNYNWSVQCADNYISSHTTTSEGRIVTVDIRYIMNSNISTNKKKYEVGNQIGESANILTNLFDYYNSPIEGNVTSDVIKGNTSFIWWNTSWSYRQPLFISGSTNFNHTETLFVNLSGLSGKISSCANEIRVVYHTQTSNSLVNSTISGGDDSTYCIVKFNANISANAVNESNYHIYYGNNLSSDPGFFVSTIEIQVQRNTTTVASGLTINDTLPISVDPAKSFLLFTSLSGASTPATGMFTSNLSSTRVQFFRNTTSTGTISWQVIQHPWINVQRGNADFLPASSQVNISINSVNISSAFILVNGRLNSSTAGQQYYGWTSARFINSTMITLERGSTGVSSNATWQVVEWPGAIVQNGSTTLTGVTSATTAINAVNLSRSFIVMSYGTTTTATTLAMQMAKARLSSSNQVNVSRVTGTGNIISQWFVVQLPGNVNVQENLPSLVSTASADRALSPQVTIGNTFHIQSWDESSASTTFTNAYASYNLTSPTNLHIQKQTATGTLRGVIYIANVSIVNLATTIEGREEKFIWRSSGPTSAGIMSWDFNSTNISSANYSAISIGIKPLYTDATSNTMFELINDSTPPNVTLISPEPGTEHNSTVTFEYIVNDSYSTINNCTQYTDNTPGAYNNFVQEGTLQYFYPYIPTGGWHNWSVCCYDYFLNLGCSENRSIFIAPPDLQILPGDIIANDSLPKLGSSIMINATIFNIGGSTAFNVLAQFFDGDPNNGGAQIGGNFTFNLTDMNGDNYNITINTTYTVSKTGPIRIYVIVDSNDSITELREYNNENFTTINVPAWHITYGNVTALNVLGFSNKTFVEWNFTNINANIYAAQTGASIDWTSLQAISQKIDNIPSSNNDFEEIDTAMNMTGFLDSINASFTSHQSPKALMNFTIYNKNITNVPVMNSTNTSNFITGIFWDTSDGFTEYNGTQDVVFVTKVNQGKQGKYGVCDYEITYPSMLASYKPSGYNTVDIYYELQ